MTNLTIDTPHYSRWGSRFFIVAGSFMVINTAFLWIRFYSDYQLSILWAAIPAIIALTFGLFGLLKLYARASVYSPLMAKIGTGFVVLACVFLGLAVVWIFGEGLRQLVLQGLLVQMALFLIAMVLAYFSSAISFLLSRAQRRIGYLLMVPWLCGLLC